jgi:hypothetical protein
MEQDGEIIVGLAKVSILAITPHQLSILIDFSILGH